MAGAQKTISIKSINEEINARLNKLNKKLDKTTADQKNAPEDNEIQGKIERLKSEIENLKQFQQELERLKFEQDLSIQLPLAGNAIEKININHIFLLLAQDAVKFYKDDPDYGFSLLAALRATQAYIDRPLSETDGRSFTDSMERIRSHTSAANHAKGALKILGGIACAVIGFIGVAAVGFPTLFILIGYPIIFAGCAAIFLGALVIKSGYLDIKMAYELRKDNSSLRLLEREIQRRNSEELQLAPLLEREIQRGNSDEPPFAPGFFGSRIEQTRGTARDTDDLGPDEAATLR